MSATTSISESTPAPAWRLPSLIALTVLSFVAQNSVAIPYVRENGWRSVQDFFVGDIQRTVPGRFAMLDLLLVVIAFHLWAFSEARRLKMTTTWVISVVVTFSVGIATAIPFFLAAREVRLGRG